MKRRMTTQRIKILEYLNSVSSHPNAEEIHSKVKKDMPAITLATVYRNLNLLSEEGKILKLKVRNEYKFDAEVSEHQHFICENCGIIFDLFQKEISAYAMRKVKAKNFTPKSVIVIFNGTCKDCSRNSL